VQQTTGIKISRVTKEDILDLSVLSKQFSKEVKEHGYNLFFNQNKFATSFLAVVDNPNYFYLVAKKNEEAIGFFIGAVIEPLFSTDIIASELFWWFEKEYRGNRAAIQMLKAFEDWAKVKNATQINVSDLQNVKNLDSLYNRLGYIRSEVTYRKNI
jgi:hypothetical protein